MFLEPTADTHWWPHETKKVKMQLGIFSKPQVHDAVHAVGTT